MSYVDSECPGRPYHHDLQSHDPVVPPPSPGLSTENYPRRSGDGAIVYGPDRDPSTTCLGGLHGTGVYVGDGNPRRRLDCGLSR